MFTNDEKDQNYQLSTTDDELKNDKTKDSIEPAKKSPSAGAQIETALFSSIATVTIFATKAPVLQLLKYLLVYNQFLHQGNHHLFLQ